MDKKMRALNKHIDFIFPRQYTLFFYLPRATEAGTAGCFSAEIWREQRASTIRT